MWFFEMVLYPLIINFLKFLLHTTGGPPSVAYILFLLPGEGFKVARYRKVGEIYKKEPNDTWKGILGLIIIIVIAANVCG